MTYTVSSGTLNPTQLNSTPSTPMYCKNITVQQWHWTTVAISHWYLSHLSCTTGIRKGCSFPYSRIPVLKGQTPNNQLNAPAIFVTLAGIWPAISHPSLLFDMSMPFFLIVYMYVKRVIVVWASLLFISLVHSLFVCCSACFELFLTRRFCDV